MSYIVYMGSRSCTHHTILERSSDVSTRIRATAVLWYTRNGIGKIDLNCTSVRRQGDVGQFMTALYEHWETLDRKWVEQYIRNDLGLSR